MLQRLIVLAITAVIILNAGLYAGQEPNTGNLQDNTGEKLRGRDFVRLGKIGTINGILSTEEGEWYLQEGVEKYELHLGDHNHRASVGLRFEQGKEAHITGFIYHQPQSKIIDIAVCAVKYEGKEYRFRNEDGTPLWRGSGRKKQHNKE